MIAIIGICYRNYTHYTLYRSCPPIYGIAIVRSLSFLFLDGFEGNANISVAIKSGSTVGEWRVFISEIVVSPSWAACWAASWAACWAARSAALSRKILEMVFIPSCLLLAAATSSILNMCVR